jgi:hypothetical protein
MNALIKRTAGIPVLIAEHAEPVAMAAQVVRVCGAIKNMPWSGLKYAPESVSRAIELEHAMPGYGVICQTGWALGEALDQPLDPALARGMVAVMLGALGKRPGDDPELYVWGLTEAIGKIASQTPKLRGQPFRPHSEWRWS